MQAWCTFSTCLIRLRLNGKNSVITATKVPLLIEMAQNKVVALPCSKRGFGNNGTEIHVKAVVKPQITGFRIIAIYDRVFRIFLEVISKQF